MTIFSNNALSHKHVLITGATGEIGFETAKVVSAMGARVTITGRNKEKLAALKTELLKGTGEDNVYALEADLTKEDERNRLVQQAEATLGFINGLVNSAGISGGNVIEKLDEAFIENMMKLNFTSTLLLTQAVYMKMKEQQEGDIVNLASLAGLRGTYGNSSYAASKFAVIGWTQSMALEAIEHNIRVNAVCPGYVDTEMGRSGIRRQGERKNLSFEEAFRETERNIPSGRISTVSEVANTVAFLLTDAARNIVGESVKISGGNVM